MWQSVEILSVFNTLILKQIFWKAIIFFSKNWSTVYQFRVLRLKMHHFRTKLPYQKPMLRQIEWWVQNGPITKNGVLPVTTLFFWKCYFSLGTSYKELIWFTNDSNPHIRIFCNRWSVIWQCFSPLSILNYKMI